METYDITEVTRQHYVKNMYLKRNGEKSFELQYYRCWRLTTFCMVFYWCIILLKVEWSVFRLFRHKYNKYCLNLDSFPNFFIMLNSKSNMSIFLFIIQVITITSNFIFYIFLVQTVYSEKLIPCADLCYGIKMKNVVVKS